MEYIVEMVAPIAVCYPINEGASMRAVFCGLPESPSDLLDKFWFKSGFPVELPVLKFPYREAGPLDLADGESKYAQFKQEKLYFVFATPKQSHETGADELWKVYTDTKHPGRICFAKYSGQSQEVKELIAQPEPFLTVFALDVEALDFANKGDLPFRIRPVDTP